MTGFNKRVFEMLGRLVVFAKAYPLFFGKDTLAGQSMAAIEAAVQKLLGLDKSLEGGSAAIKRSMDDRAKARATLRNCLETISQTAKGLKLAQFSMPRGRSDQTLVSVGQLWAEHAEPLQQIFTDSGMPDFIEKLNAAVGSLQGAIDDQTFSKGARLAAASAIEQTRGDALSALQRLDPIMNNLLRNNTPVLAVWQRARRVEKYSGVKPAAPETQPTVAET